MGKHKQFHDTRPHPWHGLPVGPNPPGIVNAFIEITPYDLVKYELDKETGFMIVDRPQLTSSLPPALYGFIPRTYCGTNVAKLMDGPTSGDHDPLDICILSERPISRGGVLLKGTVIGGIPTIDGGHADDKIIAILMNDPFWQMIHDLSDLPSAIVDRLHHYFSSYKTMPDKTSEIKVGKPYGRQHAEKL